jgi:uncharacterized protein YkwD
MAAATALTVSVGAAPAHAVSAATYEKNVITQTNKFRVKNDRVKVKSSSCVDTVAERQARWMSKNQTLKHRPTQLSKALKSCKLTAISENIAVGYSKPSAVVKAWSKSSGHRKNMLAKKMRLIGVGAVKDGDGQWWVAQVFGTKK